jgi:acyl carrier protein
MSTKDEVIDIIVEQLGKDKDEVTEDKSFIQDLGADSLDSTEIVMTLEERFGCEISDKEAESIKTVGDAIRLIDTKQK